MQRKKRSKKKSGAEAHGLEKPQVLRGLISWGRWQYSGRSAQSRCILCNHINCVVFSLPGYIWVEISATYYSQSWVVEELLHNTWIVFYCMPLSLIFMKVKDSWRWSWYSSTNSCSLWWCSSFLHVSCIFHAMSDKNENHQKSPNQKKARTRWVQCRILSDLQRRGIINTLWNKKGEQNTQKRKYRDIMWNREWRKGHPETAQYRDPSNIQSPTQALLWMPRTAYLQEPDIAVSWEAMPDSDEYRGDAHSQSLDWAQGLQWRC